MNNLVNGKILGVTDKSYYILDNLRTISGPLLFLDILIVATLFYMVYIFLYETRALRILYGLFVLLLLITIGQLFNLVLLNWILKYVTTMLIVAVPVVFQPELRGALEKLGRTKFLRNLNHSDRKYSVVDAIVDATILLSKNKTGGLIVVQRKTGLREYVENGTKIDAKISTDLLASIFYPKSPMHDGAVIVAGDRIVSVRSILPVSIARLGSGLGTRHQAAVGITENSDAVAVVISEETGTISMAVAGKLERRISEDSLRNRLKSLLVPR